MMGTPHKCARCGSDLPRWDNLPEALELELSSLKPGMRAMVLQAITDLRDLSYRVETMSKWEPR